MRPQGSRVGCLYCGALGDEVYRGLTDRLFGGDGSWSFRRCAEHDLWWLDPQPEPHELASLYPESYYTHGVEPSHSPLGLWVARAVWAARFGYRTERASTRQRLAGLVLSMIPAVHQRAAGGVMWLSSSKPGRLLDVGAGSGRFLAKMQEAGWSAIGIDPDPKAPEVARQKHAVDVRSGMSEMIAQLGDDFDAVTLSHVIEHVPDPVATLANCWSALGPAGKLVVVTPNVRSFGHRLLGADWPGLDPPRHRFLFSASTLAECARLAGLPPARPIAIGRWAPWILQTGLRLRRSRSVRDNRRSLARVGGLALEMIESLPGARYGEELVLSITKPG